MLDLKSKYDKNVKTSQQTYTIRSLLKPDISQFDLTKASVMWFRLPPPPYEIEELSFNCNQIHYKCSSLDYECTIVCKVFGQSGNEVIRFDFGPIETFIHSRLSTNLQLRVQVVLFGCLKKCTLTFDSALTLINPQNNNKYILTQQDIQSIYLKPQNSHGQHSLKQFSSDQHNVLNSPLKKTIVIENLFQRLILLKLFHQIPNRMYCHSVQVLEVLFYDESSCNIALMALNRFKYPKKEALEFSKSLSTPNQEKPNQKLMKRSNDSFSNLSMKNYSQEHPFHPHPNSNPSDQPSKKQFLPVTAFSTWKKSPKQSINSYQQSVSSGNTSKIIQRISVTRQKPELNKNQEQTQSKDVLASPKANSRQSLKQPKNSVPSTDINSNKETRQQKISFPETPITQHLKSSELIIKPNEFKVPQRRSQKEIKTQRIDEHEQRNVKNVGHYLVKKKSISVIEEPSFADENDDEHKYVNEFENILFEVNGNDDNKAEELCLNDSFAKMQEEEEKQKMQKIMFTTSVKNIKKTNQNVSPILFPKQLSRQQEQLDTLKQVLKEILEENYEIRQRNQQLKMEILGANPGGSKKDDVTKYQREIQEMKRLQPILTREIQELKAFFSQTKSNQEKISIGSSKIYAPQKKTFNRATNNNHPTQEKTQNAFSDSKIELLPKKKINPTQVKANFLQSRQSAQGDQLNYFQTEPVSPTFLARRSQDHKHSSFIRQLQGNTCSQSNLNAKNSADLNFSKLQNDPRYQKFRNNNSYSYKPMQMVRFDILGDKGGIAKKC